jgi:hypothetical protein
MREPVLARYQFPFPEGTVYFARHLLDPDTVAQVLGHAEAGAARITREGWHHLWATFGLQGLINIARRSELFGSVDDEKLAGELIRRSMVGGYDPVSGFFGAYAEDSNSFELAGLP